MKEATVTYDKWDGGEFGTMGATQAPAGTWTGSNAVVYRNGYIGPRPGLKLVTPTMPAGSDYPVQGIGYMPTSDASVKKVWWVANNKVYRFRPDNSTVTTLTGTVTITGDDYAVFKESVRNIAGYSYFTLSGGLYKIDIASGTAITRVTAGSAVPYGGDVELYRDRMVVKNGNRVYYSNAADYSTWGASSYFDVGSSWNITSMHELRDTLALLTQNSSWAVTGTIPTTNVLRRVSDALAPQAAQSVTKTNDEVLYIPGSRSAPVIYNGSFGDEGALKHLENWKDSQTYTAYAASSFGNRDVLFLSSGGANVGLWRKNYAWTKHSFGSIEVGPVCRYEDDYMILSTVTSSGGAGTYPAFYMLTLNLDRPAFTSDTYAQPGDNSTTPLTASVTLPDFVDPDGRDVRVRQVVFDYISYNTGSSTNNSITPSITPINRFNMAGDGTAWVGTTTNGGIYSVAGSGLATSGTHGIKVCNTGSTGYSQGYRLSFDLKGVVIKKVTVHLEYSENTPRR